jgi:hypothetical protein
MDCKNARRAIVLDHYGELSSAEKESLELHMRDCPACAADREETRKVLNLVSAAGSVPVPRIDPERAWRTIRAGMSGSARVRRRALAPGWRLGLAGAGVALVLAAGILIGRFGLKPAPAPLSARAKMSAAPGIVAAASLRPALASHLDDLRPLLLDFANSVDGGAPGAVVPVDERLLRGLLLQNLLLRRALNGNDPAAAEILDDLDLVLKEIVNGGGPGGATTAQVRDLIRDRGILFRMQILKKSS